MKGKPDEAKWKYDSTTYLGKPKTKVTNLSTPTRNGTTYTAQWKVPDKLLKKTNCYRATRLAVDWYLGIAGNDPKKHFSYVDERTTSSGINIGGVWIQNVYYSRSSFYPFENKPYLGYVACYVAGENPKGIGAKVNSCYTFKPPRKPTISNPVINAQTGEVSVTVTTDAGADAQERYDTRYIVKVENTKTGETYEAQNSQSTSTSFTLSFDPSDYQSLSYDEYIRVTFTAWARGYAGDSNAPYDKSVTKQYTVAFPAQVTITDKTVPTLATTTR